MKTPTNAITNAEITTKYTIRDVETENEWTKRLRRAKIENIVNKLLTGNKSAHITVKKNKTIYQLLTIPTLTLYNLLTFIRYSIVLHTPLTM